MVFKNTYDVGDAVNTPLGSGVIVDPGQAEEHQKQKLDTRGGGRVLVTLDDYKDHDGDTFVFDTTHLVHRS